MGGSDDTGSGLKLWRLAGLSFMIRNLCLDFVGWSNAGHPVFGCAYQSSG
jgi:hypothetical protein